MKKRILKTNSLKISTVYKYGIAKDKQNLLNSDPTVLTMGTVSTTIIGYN